MTGGTDQSINDRMGAMEDKLDSLIKGFHDMQRDVASMKVDVSETRELVAAYKSVKLWAQFVKWAAGVVTALGVIAAVAKGFWHR